MPILVGIDGTGEALIPGAERDADYDNSFSESFVKQICRGKANSRYFRGPVGGGGGMNEAITGAVAFIQSKRRQLPNERILLTGYSRGAAAAIMVAKDLKRMNIPVRALMMFDCVDRYIFGDAHVVPNNVGYVNHVIRNPATRSRATFGNDGLRYSPPTNYPTATMFMCTHGGMGGTPWDAKKDKKQPHDYIDEGGMEAFLSPVRHGPVWNYRTNVTYAMDAENSQRVWRHVQGFLRTHGF